MTRRYCVWDLQREADRVASEIRTAQTMTPWDRETLAGLRDLLAEVRALLSAESDRQSARDAMGDL